MQNEIYIILLWIALPIASLPIFGALFYGGIFWYAGYFLFHLSLTSFVFSGVEFIEPIVGLIYVISSISIAFITIFFLVEYPLTTELRNFEHIDQIKRWNDINVIFESDKALKENEKEEEICCVEELPQEISFFKQFLKRIKYVYKLILEKTNEYFVVDFRYHYLTGLPKNFNFTLFDEYQVCKVLDSYKRTSPKEQANMFFSLLFGFLAICTLTIERFLEIQQALISGAILLFYVFLQFHLLQYFKLKNPCLNKIVGWVNLCKTKKKCIGYRVNELSNLEIRFFESDFSHGKNFLFNCDGLQYILLPPGVSKKTLKKILDSTTNRSDFDRWVRVLAG
jgi:hypothetical protein